MLKNVGLACVVENEVLHVTTSQVARFRKVSVVNAHGEETIGTGCCGERSCTTPSHAASRSCSPCVEPGACVMADGLLKAARLALENGRHDKAADLARQAYALDPKRMKDDAAVYSLYLLVSAPTPAGSCRVNNCGPNCPCPPGCVCNPPCVCLSKPVTAAEPSLRPGLPGVDPRVVAAMEKVLAEADAKRPRLVLVIEEEQELREPASSVEIEKPFILRSVKSCGCCKNAKACRQAWQCVCDLVSADECGDLFEQVVDFRLKFMVSAEGGKTWAVSYGLGGWSVQEVPAADNDD
jgi:hypothetical protein